MLAGGIWQGSEKRVGVDWISEIVVRSSRRGAGEETETRDRIVNRG